MVSLPHCYDDLSNFEINFMEIETNEALSLKNTFQFEKFIHILYSQTSNFKKYFNFFKMLL